MLRTLGDGGLRFETVCDRGRGEKIVRNSITKTIKHKNLFWLYTSITYISSLPMGNIETNIYKKQETVFTQKHAKRVL